MKKSTSTKILPAVLLSATLAACGSSSDDSPAAPTPAPPPAGPAAGSLKVSADARLTPTQAQDLRGVTFAKDGKIYVSGHVGLATADRQTVIGRFNADGTPDATFGTGGLVTINVAQKDTANTTSTGDEQSQGIVELANGDIVVLVNAADGLGGDPITVGAGTIARPEGTNVTLLRLTSTGAPVASFGTNGRAVVDLGWTEADNAAWPAPVANAGGTALVGNGYPRDSAWTIALDPSSSGASERIVVFGAGPAPIVTSGTQRVDNDRYIARVLASNGTADPAFNSGKAFSFNALDTLGDNVRNGIVEADGKIVSAGYTNFGTGLGNHVVLFRLTSAGALDTTFPGFIPTSTVVPGLSVVPGVAVFNPLVADGGFAEAYGAARQSDGAYVTTGYGNATAVTTPPTPSTLGYASSLQPDLVSFRVRNGALDTTWGTSGRAVVQSEGKGRATNEERGRAIVALPDDRIVQFGRYGGATAVYVFTKDGVLDTRADAGVTELAGAASGDGIIELPTSPVTAQLFSAAVSADGKRLAATTNTDDTGGARLVVLDVN
ncbi:MAG: delta-60 repeat domain-containing protein [Lautropia sp.]